MLKLDSTGTLHKDMPTGWISELDQKARGVSRPPKADGKVVFIDGALPGEEVEYASYRKKPEFELAQLVRVRRPSAERVHPRCPHYGVCGGCTMQHLAADAQIAVKQRELEKCLWRIGKLRPDCILPPVLGQIWGYRRKARMSVRRVEKKGGVLVGFHEKRSSYIADMQYCAILPTYVSDLLLPLRNLLGALSICHRIPQIELAAGDRCTALVLRILAPLTAYDEALLRAFAEQHDVVFYLQPKGPASSYRFYPPENPPLDYGLPEYGLTYSFEPVDFTQVNHNMNNILVRRAMQLLDVQAGEHIVDLFCGIGNFTLPVARLGARVTGLEGSESLVGRARNIARQHGLDAGFMQTDLFNPQPHVLEEIAPCDKILLDPPRDGAVEFVKALASSPLQPRRIVYVSCNPATLARDSAILVHQQGWRCQAAGVLNMFPHTAHVESIALFVR